jgi:predicted small metal-binding protein
MEVRPMTLRCACGWETSGTEDEVVAATQEHGRRTHNMSPSRDEVLAMVAATEAAEAPGDAAPPTGP